MQTEFTLKVRRKGIGMRLYFWTGPAAGLLGARPSGDTTLPGLGLVAQVSTPVLGQGLTHAQGHRGKGKGSAHHEARLKVSGHWWVLSSAVSRGEKGTAACGATSHLGQGGRFCSCEGMRGLEAGPYGALGPGRPYPPPLVQVESVGQAGHLVHGGLCMGSECWDSDPCSGRERLTPLMALEAGGGLGLGFH